MDAEIAALEKRVEKTRAIKQGLLTGRTRLVLGVGLFSNFILHCRKCNEKWFNCRSIAESTQTAAWRFMMKASPFEDESTAEKTFSSKIEELRASRQSSLRIVLRYQDPKAELITNSHYLSCATQNATPLTHPFVRRKPASPSNPGFREEFAARL